MKENILATIFFADLMNSTEIAKNLNIPEYDDMIVDFQSTMYEVVSHHLSYFGYEGNGSDAEWSIAGDELRLFLYSGNVRYDIRTALTLGVKIKIAWLTSSFNQKILDEGRIVSRIGVGINCGKVVKAVRKWRLKIGQWQPTVEGYAINLTKRIESVSRQGSVYQIMVGDTLYNECKENRNINVVFGPAVSQVLKGFGQKIPIHEVVSFINFEILQSMPFLLQFGLAEKLEYAVTRAMPEPWIYIVLLRQYISIIRSGNHSENLEHKTIRYAEQALELMDYKLPVYNILGWIYTYGKHMKNFDMAFHYFDQTLDLDPKNEAALLHRARILDKIGHTDLAREAYKELLFQNRQHVEAQNKLEQLKQAPVMR